MFHIFQRRKSFDSSLDIQLAKEIYNKVEQIRGNFGYPSLQFSYISENSTYFHCNTGLANIKKKKKATVNSVYYIGSLSKAFIKGLILKLVQQKLISLEDSLTLYLDISPIGHKVTINHLLHHSSGLYNPLDIETSFSKNLILGKEYSIDDIINEIRSNEPIFEPGTRHLYSNTDYILLGLIAEKATNKTFSHLLKEFITIPLNLENTFYSHEDKLPNRLSTGYDVYHFKEINGGQLTSLDQCPFVPSTSGYMGAGIVANATDVAMYFLKLFDGSLLNEEYTRSARLYFGTKTLGGVTLREHVGYMPGYKSFCGYSASKKFSVALISNISDEYLLYEAVDDLIKSLVELNVVK